jgi:hypothetical protein
MLFSPSGLELEYEGWMNRCSRVVDEPDNSWFIQPTSTPF